MRKILISIFSLALLVSFLLVFSSCQIQGGNGTNGGNGNAGNGDFPGNNTGDGTDDSENGNANGDQNGGGEDEYVDPTKLVLIKNNVAQFQIVCTTNSGSDAIRAGNEFVAKLRRLGVEIDDPILDSDESLVKDCEIIIGPLARNRGEDCSVNNRDLGNDGHVVKVVGDRVVIAGGTTENTLDVFSKFVAGRMGIKDNATSVDSIVSVSRNLYDEVLTEYPVKLIRIAGYDLSKYTIILDIDKMGTYNTGLLSRFRNDLYDVSGYWLEQDHIRNIDKYSQHFIIRYVEDAGEDGFRIYVDGNDFIVECSYVNAFEPAMADFTEKYIYNATKGVVSFASNFFYSKNVSEVHYEDYGAVGDGVADDFAAIRAAHTYANQGGQKVYAQEGAVYAIYANSFISTIQIKTDVDFCGATFIVDDTGSMAYMNRTKALFTLVRDAAGNSMSQPLISQLFGDVTVKAGDTALPWIADRLTSEVSLVQLRNANHRDYVRHGANQNSGSERREVLVVYRDGTLSEDTPVAFDYDEITKLIIWDATEKPIRVGNGTFHNICNRTVPETDYMVKYHSYNRGFKIERCNSVLYDLTHRIINEPDLDLTYEGDNDGFKLAKSYGSRRESYPYNRGFFYVCDTYNLLIDNCSITGHTTYYEEKAGTQSSNAGGVNYVPAGSYDYVVEDSTHVTFNKVTQYNNAEAGLGDSRYWGIMSSNFARNLSFIDCEINRFDAHQGFWNAKLINTTVGHTINVIGGGEMYLENVTKLTGSSFMSLRGDYGATFKGDMTFKNCTLKGYNTYNSMKGGTLNTNARIKNGYVIQSGWAGNNNAGYWDWDFGYTCYMPQNITFIDKFNHETTNLYIYSGGFASYYNYLAEQDENYVAYQPTKTVTFVDWAGKQIPLNSGTIGKIFANTKIEAKSSSEEE